MTVEVLKDGLVVGITTSKMEKILTLLLGFVLGITFALYVMDKKDD